MKALGKRVAKSTGRALLEDYSVKSTQPHFYEEHVQKSEKSAVNLLDIVGKPIELAVDLRKNDKSRSSLSPTAAVGADVEELTSPVGALAGDDAKLELCDDVTKDLAVVESPPALERAKEKDALSKTKRPSDPCLEPDY